MISNLPNLKSQNPQKIRKKTKKADQIPSKIKFEKENEISSHY